MVGREKMDKQMKHRSKAEDVLITKIIKMLLLTLSMLNYLLSTCSGYSVDQKCSRVKELQKGREKHLEKVSSRMFCSHHRQMKLISKLIARLIAFFVSHKSSYLLHDLPA